MPITKSTGDHSRVRVQTDPKQRSRPPAKTPNPAALGTREGVALLERPQSGNDFSDSTFERHAELIGDPRMSRSMYAGERAGIVMQLQRDYGNRYDQRLVKHMSQNRAVAVQAKMTVGPAGDKYEREADRVAKQVMGTISSPGHESAQRQAPEEEELQMKPLVQRQVGLEGGDVGPQVEQSIKQKQGRGRALPDELRASMEGAFGADFSGVRVHSDIQADALNDSVGARAFTTGKDIFLRRGEYNPGSSGGQELLAHELTHVVQQSNGAIHRQTVPQAPGQHAADTANIVGVTPAEPAIQRDGPQDDGTLSSEDLKRLVQQEVDKLPDIDEEDIPTAADYQEGKRAGTKLGKSLGVYTEDNPEVAYLVADILGGESKSEPLPKKSSFWGRSKRRSGNGTKSSGKAAKGGSDQTLQRDPRKKVGNLGGAKHRWQDADKQGIASTGASWTEEINTWGGGVVSTVAEFGGKAAKAGTDVLGHIGSVIGLAFSVVNLVLDFNSFLSSKAKAKTLESVREKAINDGEPPEVVNAVLYAINQKYEKALRRAYSAIGDAAGVMGGVLAVGALLVGAALVSNPVGWGIFVFCSVLAGLIGGAYLIYKIGRYFWKKRTGVLGKRRGEVAMLLYRQWVNERNTAAGNALRVMGLDTDALLDNAESEYDDRIRFVNRREKIIEKYQARLANFEWMKKMADRDWDAKSDAIDVLDAEIEKTGDYYGPESDEVDALYKELASHEKQQAKAEKGIKKTKAKLEWKGLRKSIRNDIHKIEDKLASS